MAMLIGSKKDEKTGEFSAIYSKDKILDGITAFEAMLCWMEIYFKDNFTTEVGEMLSRISFTGGRFVEYEECWDLWEKCVAERIEANKDE